MSTPPAPLDREQLAALVTRIGYSGHVTDDEATALFHLADDLRAPTTTSDPTHSRAQVRRGEEE